MLRSLSRFIKLAIVKCQNVLLQLFPDVTSTLYTFPELTSTPASIVDVTLGIYCGTDGAENERL